MLIGGMFDVDVEKCLYPQEKRDFYLRCDTEKQYQRRKFTNNGRTATTYLFQNALSVPRGKKILAPEYMCVSVVNALEASDVNFETYRVKEGLIVDIEDLKSKITDEVEAIYLIHYFGFPQPEEVADELKRLACEKNIKIVEDLTQALLTKEENTIGYGDYLVGSVRKWFPITDGGIAAAKEGREWKDVPLKDAYDEAVYTQMFLSLARTWYEKKETLNDDTYLTLEKNANSKRYVDFEPREMTRISQEILSQCDLEDASRKRRANYTYLYDRLRNIPGLGILGRQLDDEGKYVPFGFPVLADHRDQLYQYLRVHKIIGEIQWVLPVQYYEPSAYAQYLSEHNIMLQCDQRYTEADMAYTVDIIEKYFKLENENG